MYVLLFFLKKKLFFEVREDIFTQSEIKIQIFFPYYFSFKTTISWTDKSCENHFHEFCCLVKNPKKKLVPEKKNEICVRTKTKYTKIRVPSFGPNEKPGTVKNVFIHFVRSDTANVLFIERKNNIGKAGLKVILNCGQSCWPAKQVIAWPRLIFDQSKCWNIAIKFYYKTLIYY